ncbi:MAG: hypothetical protein QOH10_632 [Actinomycetota bacterium]|nr:hypothetical protein [Actinomycetota bacterium]
MPQPVVVHIGFHKTATTWLQLLLFPNHPRLRKYVSGFVWDDPFLREIVAASDREFDPARAREAYEAGLAGLGALAPDDVVVVSAERLSGHAASGGFDTFRIARRLRETVPEARVLIVVRSQVDMIESEYRQLVGEGYPGRISSLWSSDPWRTVQFDLGHYEYDTLVRTYQEHFGAENVAVFSYEGLAADHSRFLDRLAAFFGIAPFELAADVGKRSIHPGLPNRGLAMIRVLNHFRRSEHNRFPVVDIGDWWRLPIIRVAHRLPRRRHVIPAAKRAELAARYRDSNERLAKLVPGEDFEAFASKLESSAS